MFIDFSQPCIPELFHQLLITDGEFDAYVRASIILRTESASKLSELLPSLLHEFEQNISNRHNLSDHTSIYWETYLKTIQKMINHLAYDVESLIFRGVYEKSGKREAIQSVIKTYKQSDVGVLEDKLEDNRETDRLASATMSPTASPRLYRKGYISGLLESIDLIKKVQGGANLPCINWPDWFISDAVPRLTELMNKPLPEPEGGAFYREAIEFILFTGGDLLRLDRKITSRKRNLEEIDQQDDYQTYVWRKSYLTGLQDAREILSNAVSTSQNG